MFIFVIKSSIMTTISLKINERSKMGKIILELIKVSSEENQGVEIIHVPNAETIKAIEDVQKGKTTKVKNSQELFKNLGI
jgi:hypothetical protein